MIQQGYYGVYQTPMIGGMGLNESANQGQMGSEPNQMQAGIAEDYPIQVFPRVGEEDPAVLEDNKFNQHIEQIQSPQTNEQQLEQIQSPPGFVHNQCHTTPNTCSPMRIQALSPQIHNQMMYNMQNNPLVIHQPQGYQPNYSSPQFHYPPFQNQQYPQHFQYPHGQINMQAGMVNSGYYAGRHCYVQTPPHNIQPATTPPMIRKKQSKFDKIHHIRIPINNKPRRPKPLTKLDEDGEETFVRVPDFLRRPKRFNRLQNSRQNGVRRRPKRILFEEEECKCCTEFVEEAPKYDKVRFKDCLKAIEPKNYVKELEFDDVFGESFNFGEFVHMVPVFTQTYSEKVHFDYVKIARTSQEKEQKVKVRNIAQLFGVNFGSATQMDHNNYKRFLCHGDGTCPQRQYYREILKNTIGGFENALQQNEIFLIIIRFLGCAPLTNICQNLPEIWKALRIQSKPAAVPDNLKSSDKSVDIWSEHVCMVTKNNYHIFQRDYELVTKTMLKEKKLKREKERNA